MTSETKALDQRYFKKLLLLKKKEIQFEAEAGMAAAAAVTLDQTSVGRVSRVDALQAQAISVAAQERRAVDLRKIEAALKRVEEDEYGYCQECGNAIALPRLEINLAAEFCVVCASQHEKG